MSHWSARRLCQLLVAVCLLVGGPPAAWAATTVTVAGPNTVTGDGKTAVTMTVVIDPPMGAGKGNLELVPSAGKATRLRGAGEGKFEFDFIPPLVAESMPVKIRVRIVGGAHANPLELEVTPDIGAAKIHKTGGPLDLRIPERLVLGRDTSAKISVRPVEGLTLSMAVSVGSVSAPTVEADGRLSWTYTPPEEKYPQVAIIAATSEDGAVVDWATIPLWGRPLVTAKSEANTAVRVRVANIEYGPIRTDRHGRAKLRVLAPPGVALAYAVARDAAGNEQAAPLKLGVPDFRRTLGLCPPKSGRMLYLAVNATGKPRKGITLEGESSLGTVESSTSVEPGFYETRVVFPDDAKLGEQLELRVRIPGEQGTDHQCTTVVPGEAPSGLSVKLDPAKYVAGGGGTVKVKILLSYPGKRHPRTVPIQLSADFGTLGKPRLLSPAEYEADWTLPDAFSGRASAHVDATTVGRPVLRAGVALTLSPGAVARIEISTGRSALWANGQSSTTLTAEVQDAHGNGIPGLKLAATGAGEIGQFVAKAPGEYEASYVAPSSGGGTDTIVVQDATGKVRGSASIRLIPGQRIRVSARLGYLTNLAKVSAFMVMAGGGVRLPVLDHGLVAGIETGYYGSEKTQRDEDDVEDVTVSASVVPLLARLEYEMPLQPLIPRLCAHAGAVWAKTEVSSDSTDAAVAQSFTWALGVCAGAGIAVGPGIAGLEVGYLYAPVDESGLEGNVGGIDATIGYALGF